MSALEKTPNLAIQDEQPAEQAGIFLETIPIYPYELVQSAVTRINSLIKRHGAISQKVSPDYKNIDIFVE